MIYSTVVSAAPTEHQCEWRAEAEALRARATAAEARVAELEDKVAALIKALYGKKSEKMPRPVDALRRNGKLPPPDPAAIQRKRAQGRKWKADLPEETVEHPVPADLPTCELCGTEPSHPMPPRVTHEYEYVPGRMVCRRHVQRGARCTCGSCIVSAPPPPRVFEGGHYGPRFIAHAIVAKCCDAMPLFRHARRLKREGIPISPKTLGDLFHRSARLLEPLYKRILERIAAQTVVHGDETRIEVQARKKTRRAWMWVFLTRTLVAYVFSASRSGKTPSRVLGSTTGTLVVDAYTGYNEVCTPDKRERAGCLAHVRRKVFDARRNNPAMQRGLDLILEVYLVEHEAKERGIVRTPEHAELRRTRSRAAMDELRKWLLQQQPLYLPSEPAGKAVRYALDNWQQLCVFLDNVRVPPDNNSAEAALRVVAKTRDASLFVGNDKAGTNLGILLTLVNSAQACGHNPEEYLADVLLRVHDTPQSRIDELLPDAWQAPSPSA